MENQEVCLMKFFFMRGKMLVIFVSNWIDKCGNLENIFNIDETALFYKLLPSTTKATSQSQGQKIDKDRLTVAFIVNAVGNDKIKPIIIGKHKNLIALVIAIQIQSSLTITI